VVVINDTGYEVVPSEYVKLQGDIPCRSKVRFVETPAHMVAVPLIVAVCPSAEKATSIQQPAASNSFFRPILVFKI
jgi:hypothetical protein